MDIRGLMHPGSAGDYSLPSETEYLKNMKGIDESREQGRSTSKTQHKVPCRYSPWCSMLD